VVEIDYVRRSVSCFEPSQYQLPRGTWEPLILRDRRPGVTVRLEGGAEGVFMLDTGNSTTAVLFRHFVDRNPQVKISDVRPYRLLGVEGERDLFAGQIAWFELGGRRLKRPWAIFEGPAPPMSSAATWFDGIIGASALRRSVVLLNYPAGKIAFLPASAASPPDIKRDSAE
jgi:hypothetical protein